MEVILLGALTTFITEVVKQITKKISNKELAKAVVILLTLIISVIGGAVYFYGKTKLSPELIEQIITIWGVSIGFYELAYKQAVQPAIKAVWPAK